MATLTIDQIKTVIVKNPNKALVAAGVQKSKDLRMHIYGTGLDKHLKLIPGHEKEHLKKLRVEYTRSNRDVFTRLGRPIDKVFTAKGGSLYYNLPEEMEKRARGLTSDIRNGYSVKDWIENFWKPHYCDDPCGVVMMEIMPEEQALAALDAGESVVYPCYWAISAIYDYQPKGIFLDYIAVELCAEEKAEYGIKPELKGYRLIDDAFDYIIERHGDQITIINQHTLVNLFGYVPGFINSDIVDPEVKDSFNSVYTDVVELADEFLMKGSIKVTSDFRHGFPKYAEFADDCPVCKGTGVLLADECPECKGSGKNPQVYVSQNKILKWPEEGAPVILPKDTGGYVEPSKNYHEIAISDMTMLENYMSLTMWGTTSRVQQSGVQQNGGSAGDRTATQEMNEIKPQSDRLYHISKAAEKRDKFIRDAIISIQVMAAYGGCSSNYGRRYMLEGPDVLWLRYSDARAKGVAISALDNLLMQYYEAEFVSDPMKLEVMIKLMKVEPFVHYKTSEVLNFKIGDADYKAKLYFGEWLSEQTEAYILAMDTKMLRESLYQYADAKQLQAPAPAPAPFGGN